MKIIVSHGFYGCDTGCCGHYIEVDDKEVGWTFSHPYSKEDYRKWAEDWVTDKFGAEHVADLDWENCHITND